MANFDDLIKQMVTGVVSDVLTSSGLRRKTISSQLKYPLNNQQDYGGTITFKAYTPEYETLGAKAIDFLAPEYQEPVNVNPRAEEFRRREQQIASLQNKQSFQIASAKKSSVDTRTKTEKARPDIGSGRRCTLYLPGAIQVRDTVAYSNLDLGVIGATVRAGITSDKSAGEILADVGTGIKDTFGSLITSLRTGAGSEEAQIAAQRVFGTSSAVSGAISSATGVAVNPNRRAVLSGPELRTFTFTFRLVPTSPAEGQAVEDIIKFFREEMYPDAVERGGISAAFRYPSLFEIKMKYRTADGRYKNVATQLLPSFLNSVDVNYNQSGMSFHRDGRPQEATLTLNFTEERTLNKYDVAVKGY